MTTIDVHRVRSDGPDALIGHVDDEGRVYRAQSGPDDLVGHVDLASGRVYESLHGPDKLVGHVDLADGRCYGARLGPDHYLGRISPDGSMHVQRPLAPDERVATSKPYLGPAPAGAAFILLVVPLLEEEPSTSDDVSQPETRP